MLQVLQEQYVAVQKFTAMIHGRQAIDSHAVALLSHVQSIIESGQLWIQQHQTIASLFDMLAESEQPYSFGHSAVRATEEICKDFVRVMCVFCGIVSKAL